jgi:biofilm protein TabA
MIIDRLENLAKYIPVLPQLKEVVAILESRALSVLPLGGYLCDDPSLRYTIVSYKTEAVDERPYEIHRRDADVQILLAGRERMDVGDSESFVPTGEYNADRDFVYGNGEKIASYHADPSLFVIFFPGEPHAPNIANGKNRDVKKVIFKIIV